MKWTDRVHDDTWSASIAENYRLGLGLRSRCAQRFSENGVIYGRKW